MLAKVGPKGLPIGMPSTCVYNVLLKMNGELATVVVRRERNCLRDKPSIVEVGVGKRELIMMSMVSSVGMLVNKFWMSKEVM